MHAFVILFCPQYHKSQFPECQCLRVQAVEGRPLPGPSDADRAGEFSFGRLELGGPISSRFSAIVVSFGRLLQIDN